jgi:hypothetical protein
MTNQLKIWVDEILNEQKYIAQSEKDKYNKYGENLAGVVDENKDGKIDRDDLGVAERKALAKRNTPEQNAMMEKIKLESKKQKDNEKKFEKDLNLDFFGIEPKTKPKDKMGPISGTYSVVKKKE